jgi:hypothetical protein
MIVNDYSEFSLEELIQMKENLSHEATSLHNKQLSLKIMINSLYGCMANRFFRGFDIRLASSITDSGRRCISFIGQYVNDKLKEALVKKGVENPKDVLVYSDTDSVVGDSIIEIIGYGKTTIEDFYTNCEHIRIEYKDKNNIVKVLPPHYYNVVSINEKYTDHERIVNVKHIMKHMVKKRMYEFQTHKNSVIVTEDHSIMIMRDGNLIACKPHEILPFDKGLDYNWKVSESSIYVRDLGIREEWVYDIHTENNMFFANGILVHNSCYFSVEQIVDLFFNNSRPSEYKEVVKFIDKFYSVKIDALIKEAISLLAKEFQAEDIHNDHGYFTMNREVIGSHAFWESKKRYCIRVHDNEGILYDEPKLKIMGMSLVRRNTPPIVKKAMKESLQVLLDGDEKKFRIFVKKFNKEFNQCDYTDVAEIKPANNLSKYSLPNGKFAKGTPSQVRAAILYNHILDTLNLTDKYPKIVEGDKVKIIHLKTPNKYNSSYIAFPLSSKIPDEFGLANLIDYQTQYEKMFFNPIKSFMEILNWDILGRKKFDFII